jgi:hypothetical protein
VLVVVISVPLVSLILVPVSSLMVVMFMLMTGVLIVVVIVTLVSDVTLAAVSVLGVSVSVSVIVTTLTPGKIVVVMVPILVSWVSAVAVAVDLVSIVSVMMLMVVAVVEGGAVEVGIEKVGSLAVVEGTDGTVVSIAVLVMILVICVVVDEIVVVSVGNGTNSDVEAETRELLQLSGYSRGSLNALQISIGSASIGKLFIHNLPVLGADNSIRLSFLSVITLIFITTSSSAQVFFQWTSHWTAYSPDASIIVVSLEKRVSDVACVS